MQSYASAQGLVSKSEISTQIPPFTYKVQTESND